MMVTQREERQRLSIYPNLLAALVTLDSASSHFVCMTGIEASLNPSKAALVADAELRLVRALSAAREVVGRAGQGK